MSWLWLCLISRKIHQLLRIVFTDFFFLIVTYVSFFPLQMYDKDNSGTIELNEMVEVMIAFDKIDRISAEER